MVRQELVLLAGLYDIVKDSPCSFLGKWGVLMKIRGRYFEEDTSFSCRKKHLYFPAVIKICSVASDF